jgi:hypothetical protein
MNGLMRFGGLVVDPNRVIAISVDNNGDARVLVTTASGFIERFDTRADDAGLLVKFLSESDSRVATSHTEAPPERVQDPLERALAFIEGLSAAMTPSTMRTVAAIRSLAAQYESGEQ